MPEQRTGHAAPSDLLTAVVGTPAERATLVQISSAFCAPCRAARTVLARVADTTPGVRHVEVDVAGHEDLAEQLQVRSTPVVLVLDAAGRVCERLDGVPRLPWLRAVVGRVTGG